MSKKIYLAGKVSGLELHKASQKFGLKQKELMNQGHTVIVPLDIIGWHETWEAAMKKCIPAMLECDEVHFLPCWQESRGAQLERDIAIRIGMPVVYH
jgi:hypothetical protein